MSTGSVLLFGDINVDNIIAVDEIPEPGRDSYASQFEMHLGGVVSNSAVILQGLGQPASLSSAVGDDLWANFIFDELTRSGVNLDHVIKKRGYHTGVIFIAVLPNGERTMFSYRGVNTAITPDDLSETVLDDIQMVQLTGYALVESPQKETAWHLIRMADDRGIPISMDTGLDPVILKPDLLQEVLPYLTVLITARKESMILSKSDDFSTQVEYFLSQGLKQVGLKLGAQGALIGSALGIEQMPAFPVKVVDTTSAGDAFSAGMIYGYLHAFSPKASLVLANALGGMATTVYGSAKIKRSDVLKFLFKMQSLDNFQKYRAAVNEVIQKLETQVEAA